MTHLSNVLKFPTAIDTSGSLKSNAIISSFRRTGRELREHRINGLPGRSLDAKRSFYIGDR